MTAKKATSKLPPNVTESDCKYPEMGKGLPYATLKELGLDFDSGFGHCLTFYFCEGRHEAGWVLTTLHISNPSRRAKPGTTARYYGIGVADKKLYTVGKGPHVTAECQVYLSQDNLDRMLPYIELWKKGMALAGATRDRISTRRARGQQYRADGKTSWYW